MAGLVLLIVSVSALDSLNPSTLGPALLLAVGRRPVRDVAAFLFGVWAVSTAGGLGLLLGPGHALLTRVARPSGHTQHLFETAAGAVLLGIALALWLSRHRVRDRIAGAKRRGSGSAFVLGAGIMAIELPTAFPYFAGLVAVVESGRSLPTQVALVLTYNAVFVAPLALVLLLVAIGGSAAERRAQFARKKLEALAPTLVPAALAIIGAALLTVGAAEL